VDLNAIADEGVQLVTFAEWLIATLDFDLTREYGIPADEVPCWLADQVCGYLADRAAAAMLAGAAVR
jgi:hypothetical protein